PATGAYQCRNFNRDDDGTKVFAFHSRDYCVQTDLNHAWDGTHMEINYVAPNATRRLSPNDGFVLVNDDTNQPDKGGESRIEDETMSFYNEEDIGFYYDLAKTVAISDPHFSSVLGPTFPNCSYLMAATSFGHIAYETVPDINMVQQGLVSRPLAGTIFDLLDQHNVSWANYFNDNPQGVSFRPFLADPVHFRLFDKPALPQLPDPIRELYNGFYGLMNS